MDAVVFVDETKKKSTTDVRNQTSMFVATKLLYANGAYTTWNATRRFHLIVLSTKTTHHLQKTVAVPEVSRSSNCAHISLELHGNTMYRPQECQANRGGGGGGGAYEPHPTAQTRSKRLQYLKGSQNTPTYTVPKSRQQRRQQNITYVFVLVSFAAREGNSSHLSHKKTEKIQEKFCGASGALQSGT